MSKKIYIAVDVQNDFVSGALGSDWAQEVAPKIVDFVKMIRESDSDAPIIATRDTHYVADDEYRIGYSHSLEGEKLPVPHCIQHSDGWQVVDGLRNNIDSFIDKDTFMSTELPYVVGGIIDKNSTRSGHQIDEIVLFGFCTSICVISNALHLRGHFPNMKITVLKNLCGDINEESHNAALKVMENCQIDVTDSRIFTYNKLSSLNKKRDFSALIAESVGEYCLSCWDCKYFTRSGGHGSSDWGYCNQSKLSGKNDVLADDCCKYFKDKKDKENGNV